MRKRYKITGGPIASSLPSPSDADGAPTPQNKPRGFNNAAYQVDDPNNMIQPSSFQIIYSYNTTSPTTTNNNNNLSDNVHRQPNGGARDGDAADGKVYFNDKNLMSTRFTGATTAKEAGNRSRADSLDIELNELKRQNYASYDAPPSNRATPSKVLNSQHEERDQGKQQAKPYAEVRVALDYSDEDEGDFRLTAKKKALNSDLRPTPPAGGPGQPFHWSAPQSSNARGGAGVAESSHSKRFYPDNSSNISTTKSCQNKTFTKGAKEGSFVPENNVYIGFGPRPVEHDYEEIDADQAFHTFKPRPLPRSIHNVKSDTLKRKTLTSQETIPMRGRHFPLADTREGTKYCNTFDTTKTNRGDPSIVLGVRRGSDGCLTEYSSKPYSIRYDYPRHSDGSVTYTPHSPIQEPPNKLGNHFQKKPVESPSPSYMAPAPPGSNPAQIFSLPQFPDLYGSIPSPLMTSEMKAPRESKAVYANTGPKAEGVSSSLRAKQEDFSNWYAASNSLAQAPNSLMDETSFYRRSDSRDRPAMKFDSGGYVTSVEAMKKYAQLDSSRRSSSCDDGLAPSMSREVQSPRSSKTRRKSEPFSDRLFRRSRTFELSGDREMTVDVNWWDDDDDDDDDDGSGTDYGEEPSGSFSVSSFV